MFLGMSLLIDVMSSSEMIVQIMNIAEMFLTDHTVHFNCVYMQGFHMPLNTVGVQHFAAKLALDSSML